MKSRLEWVWAALFCVLLAACATTRERVEAFVFVDPSRFEQTVNAWLRSVEVVENGLPPASDYPLIEDSLAAIAGRYGFRMSTVRSGQPYVVDLAVHERSFTADLATRYSVMAVLNVSSTGSADDARVVYSAVSGESIVSLYSLYQIGESLFSSLRSGVDELVVKRAKDKKAETASAVKIRASQ